MSAGQRGEQSVGGSRVTELTCGECEGDDSALIVGYGVDFRARSASRSTKGLRRSPPFPPDAARCALAVVLSMACRPPGVTFQRLAARPVGQRRLDQRCEVFLYAACAAASFCGCTGRTESRRMPARASSLPTLRS